MTDDTNQNSGGTIDLRGTQGTQGNPQSTAAGAGVTPTGAQGATQNATAATSAIPADVLKKFEIPESVKQQYANLIPLIIETESMNDEERQYWFQILPIMTDAQVTKLREILTKEKDQLQKLDKEYEKELKRINDKHAVEWKAFEAKEKRRKLHAVESKSEKTEQEKEEELLKKLGEL